MSHTRGHPSSYVISGHILFFCLIEPFLLSHHYALEKMNLKYKVKSAETPFIMQLAGVNKMEIDLCSNQYHHTDCDE